MNNRLNNGCRTPGAWQQEIEEIDLQIRDHQAVIDQLRASRQAILEKHKKRRKCLWDADTPMRNLVPLAYESHFITMMKEWGKHTTHTIQPMKTTHFCFVLERKRHVIHALAMMLIKDENVFKVSKSELCRYLESHSNLGDAESIRKAINRMIAQINQELSKAKA